MNSAKKWIVITIGVLILVTGFQNCAPVSFQQTPAIESSPDATSVPEVLPKTCELENKIEGQTWMTAAGQERIMVPCFVGQGNQFKVYDVSNEYICTDGKAQLTGKVDRNYLGLDGLCNLDCGSHKNGEKWWMDLATSSETLQCATSLNATSTVTYQNTAEYQCVNSVASATGKLTKTKLSETACPPLTFNDQDNQATLAFEDVPENSDSDYNDFVANIKAVETYSSLGQLSKIVLEYTAKGYGAGMDHKLVSIFDGNVRGRDGWVSNQNLFKSEAMFEGAATIVVEHYVDSMRTSSLMVPKDQDLVVFSSTRSSTAQKEMVRITITNIDGSLNTLAKRGGVSIKRYRTLLYVPDATGFSKNKKYDVDIADINPSAFDDKGRPLAIFVPINWRIPLPGIDIGTAYPDFQLHANYMRDVTVNPNLVETDKAKSWFNNVVLKNVSPL